MMIDEYERLMLDIYGAIDHETDHGNLSKRVGFEAMSAIYRLSRGCRDYQDTVVRLQNELAALRDQHAKLAEAYAQLIHTSPADIPS